jgi:lysophospholipase L1-like esterase
MHRLAPLAVLALAPAAFAGDLIDSMDRIRWLAPKGKGKAELVEGRDGKAVRFSFEKDARSAFFTSRHRGSPAWDRAAGLSFWVRGEEDSFGGIELIFDNDFAVRYDLCFPIKAKKWTKVTAAWGDFVPVLPGPKSKRLGLPGGNAPSKVSAVWVGKWWYWRDYPAQSFAIDDLRLEEKIERDAKEYRPEGAPLARVLKKLKAGQPVTITTVGDSLTDTRHWANREVSWPALLRKQLEAKYKSKVTIINPAIGGTQLRQNVILMPRWLAAAHEPDLVLYCFGGNDWEAGMRGPQFRESCEDAILRTRRATHGKADVMLLTTVPAASAWETRKELAEACRAAAKATKAGLADAEKAFHEAGKKDKEALFVKDRVHLSAKGHEVMARVVLEAVGRAGE